MAGRAAAVPAEVVELVADVRHRRLVDDSSIFGVHDGEEVWCAYARSFVEAGEVEELLARCVLSFSWRPVHDALLAR
jgi:hypothetical protein